MPPIRFSKNKAIYLALAVVAILILFPTLFRVIFAAEREISYSAGAGVSTCGDFYIRQESERLSCISTYNIAVGNTGSTHQKLIVIELSSVPENRRLNWNALDIVATNRRASGPEMSSQQRDGKLTIEIQDLQPNRLVEISLSSQGAQFAEQVENIDVSLEAEGSLIEANPRLTVSLRFLGNLSAFFGF